MGETGGAETAPALSAEDAKLVVLARATRARVSAAEGAAVRDSDGRTYAAATVDLPSLRLSALQVCVAMAVASGSRGLEAAVVLTDVATPAAPHLAESAEAAPDLAESDLAESDLAALRDFGGHGVVVHLGDPRGAVTSTTRT